MSPGRCRADRRRWDPRGQPACVAGGQPVLKLFPAEAAVGHLPGAGGQATAAGLHIPRLGQHVAGWFVVGGALAPPADMRL